MKITEGSILVEVWGYEQTNADFYRVEKRTAKMVKLAPLERISQIGATLTGTAVPGKVVEGPALRRKILVHQEEEMWPRGRGFCAFGMASLSKFLPMRNFKGRPLGRAAFDPPP